MAAYRINGVDDSADGMERLRSQSEIILLAYPHEGDSPLFLQQSWLEDLDSCERPEGFDYAAADSAIRAYCRESADYLRRLLQSATPGDPEGGETDPRPFRLYMESGNGE